MTDKEKIKDLMPALRKRYAEQSVRLQPKPGTFGMEGVYEVHVRPFHAEEIADLEWVLKETGPLDMIARNNGVFFDDREIRSPKSSTSNEPRRGNVSSRLRGVRR